MLALATCASLLLAAGAPPVPAMPEVRWEAPPGCPGEASVRAQIAALLARAPAGAGQAARVVLRVERLPGGRWGLEATIFSPDGQGRRSLQADRCEALAEAAALLTAIAAAPGLQAGPSGPPAEPAGVQAGPGMQAEPSVPVSGAQAGPGAEPSVAVPGAQAGPAGAAGPGAPVVPEAPASASGAVAQGDEPSRGMQTPAAPASDEPAELPEPVASAPRPQAVRAVLGLGAGVGVGALPGASALLRAVVGVRGQRWSVALTQSFWLPRDLPAAADARVGGRMWLAATGLRGCGIAGKGRVEWPLCAGIEVGALRGKGIGDLAVTGRATSAWAAASAGPGMHVRVAPQVALTLGVDVLVMLTRVRFEVADRGAVCCTAPVGATATAGLHVQLP